MQRNMHEHYRMSTYQMGIHNTWEWTHVLYVYYMVEMNFFYCLVCHHLLAKTGGSLEERNRMSGMCCGKHHSGCQLSAKGCFFCAHVAEEAVCFCTYMQHLETGALRVCEWQKRGRRRKHHCDRYYWWRLKQQRQKLGCRKHNPTITVNADRSPVFQSSNYSIWPAHLIVNELPPHIRWSNIISVLLWYGTKQSDMTPLRQAFMEQMKELSTEGIYWSHNGEQQHSKVCYSTIIASVILDNTFPPETSDCILLPV